MKNSLVIGRKNDLMPEAAEVKKNTSYESSYLEGNMKSNRIGLFFNQIEYVYNLQLITVLRI